MERLWSTDELVGDDIPVSAWLMAIADVFDALTCRRVYKEPMPFGKHWRSSPQNGVVISIRTSSTPSSITDELQAIAHRYRETDVELMAKQEEGRRRLGPQ